MLRPRTLLLGGLVLRVVVFAYLSPTNNDVAHMDNVRIIATEGRLPLTGETGQSYHPALAHLLAAGPYLLGGPKAAQALSLLFSCLTLLLIWRLLQDRELFRERSTRQHGMLLAALCPEFLFFGLHVSNDPLTLLLGAALVACLWALVAGRLPGMRGHAVLIAICVLGLWTKHSFLALVPVAVLVVAAVELRRGITVPRTLGIAALVGAITLGLGSYKLVENRLHHGRALISNLDANPPFAIQQRTAHAGLASYVTMDLPGLLRNPATVGTPASYPLILYASFWYPHIRHSNIRTTRRAPVYYLGSLLYLLGLLPTLVVMRGASASWPRSALLRPPPDDTTHAASDLMAAVALALPAALLALLVTALLKYQVYSIAQARLLLPTGAALLLLYDRGLSALGPGTLRDRALPAAMGAIAVTYLGVYGIELTYHVALALDPDLVLQVQQALQAH